MTRLFLDVEWADVVGSELVSLALVSADGQQRFYAEVHSLPPHPTDFVRMVVYPLLEQGGHAMSHRELTLRLRAFLTSIDQPVVIYDYEVDGALLNYALDGFDMASSVVDGFPPRPTPRHLLVARDANLYQLVEAYFAAHSDAAARRHHAGIDAEALRQAWCALAGLIRGEWSDQVIARLRQQHLPATVIDPESSTKSGSRTL